MLEGGDLDIRCIVWVDRDDLKIVAIYDADVKEGRISDLCQAINDINFHQAYGSFNFDDSDNTVGYVCCFPHFDKRLSQKDVGRLLDTVCSTARAKTERLMEFFEEIEGEEHDDTEEEAAAGLSALFG